MFAGIYRSARLRRTASFFLGGSLFFSSGCSLIPSRDDIYDAGQTVKDTVSGKAARDRRTKNFSEARILERRKDFAGAERLYREVLAERPKNLDCHHRLAVMASVQGKYEEAMTLYRQALDCGNPTADLWSDLGYCHYLQQQMPEAEGALRQALTLDPKHRSAMNNLALVVGEQGRLDESYTLFRQANNEAEAEANYAYLLAQWGDFTKSQEHYSRALSIEPDMRSAIDGLMQVTQRLQQQLDHPPQQPPQPGSPQPGSPEAPGAQAVQQVSYNAPAGPAKRPLIEVFTAASALPARGSQSTVAALNNAQSAGGATPELRRYTPESAPPQSPPGPAIAANMPAGAQPMTGQPALNSQPTPPGAPPAPVPVSPWGVVNGAPQPFSFPQQTQPAYLQPTAQAPSSQSANNSTPSGGAPWQAPQPSGNFPTTMRK